MKVTVDTKDLKITQEFFEKESQENRKKILIASYKKDMQPLLRLARSYAPSDYRGDLRRSIKMRELKNETGVEVGSDPNTPHLVKVKGQWRLTKVWYGWLLEIGSYKGMRYHRHARGFKQIPGKRSPKGIPIKRGDTTGVLKAYHYLEKANDAVKGQIGKNITKDWYDIINRKITANNNRLKK